MNTAPATRAPQPTSPLSYVANKGETRQAGNVFWTWDGHDWVQTVFPTAQLDKQPVMPLADGVVELGAGLSVAGTSPELPFSDSLYVNGRSHTTGDHEIDGRGYAIDFNFIRRSELGATTRYVQDLDRDQAFGPQGFDVEIKQTANGGIGGAESYAGVGITWVYKASRRLKITSKCMILATTCTSPCESRMIIRGAPGSGVSTSDPRLDLSTHNITQGLRNTHFITTYIPPNTWTDGIQVYVAVFLDLFNAGAGYGFQRLSDPSFPTSCIKEDWGG